MALCGDLCKLLGPKSSMKSAGPLLTTFWSRYKAAHPQHQLFKQSIPLERAVPLFLHGDEGETYKKSGVLIVSFQSCLGLGSLRTPDSARQVEDEAFLEKAGIPVNFLKTGLQSRYLCGVVPKAGPFAKSMYVCMLAYGIYIAYIQYMLLSTFKLYIYLYPKQYSSTVMFVLSNLPLCMHLPVRRCTRTMRQCGNLCSRLS